METFLALALGLVVGLIAGLVFGGGWTIGVYSRAVRRELDAGRITREVADRLATLRDA